MMWSYCCSPTFFTWDLEFTSEANNISEMNFWKFMQNIIYLWFVPIEGRGSLTSIRFLGSLTFFGRNDDKTEAPVLRPPHAKSWLIGKDSDAGRDWGQEEKGTTEAEMAGWHHWFDGRESEWTSGVGDGQGGLACCDSRGRKELDTTEWLKWTELNWTFIKLLGIAIVLSSGDDHNSLLLLWEV